MLDQGQLSKIKLATQEFFEKMTIEIADIKVSSSPVEGKINDAPTLTEEAKDVVDIEVELNEPQILIGQQGQTLFEIQRLLRTVLNKRLQKLIYFNLDINGYKKKKVEYLKTLAKELADQAVLTKEERPLLPMSSYERRIIHAELSQRNDVATESRGDGFDRHIVILPK